ncbi:MAG: alkaline phosphatase D family protein [Bacteroidota bacterium]
MKFFHIVFLFSVSCTSSYSQQNKLVAGPMQGHITATTAKVWLFTKKVNVVNVILTDKISKTSKTVIVHTDTIKPVNKQYPMTVEFKDLQPDTDYELSLQFDNIPIEKKSNLKTLKQAAVADFSFLTGSCAMQLSWVLKPFTRMGSDNIFEYMLKVPADFMIWLGDNSYYIKRTFAEDDFASAKGMWKKQIKTRKMKRMNNFMVAYPQYAIWDDHDFGSYDADGSFPLKDTSLSIYKSIWANPSYGLPETKGIFTSFRKYDAEFILLDDRFYRTEPFAKNGTMLGKAQLNWLFSKLKQSDATFKFIILGSQFINPCSTSECYNQFPDEKKEIYNFLEDNNIKGVIFITGDSHYADLQKEERKNTYPLYDFTCSPLTSFLDKPTELEKANTSRVLNTLTPHRNFGKVSVNGPAGKRVCTIELYDDSAKLLWKHDIPEEELR